jgi:hypothetical protein
MTGHAFEALRGQYAGVALGPAPAGEPDQRCEDHAICPFADHGIGRRIVLQPAADFGKQRIAHEHFGFRSSSGTPSARLATDAPKNGITVLKGDATRLDALAGRDSSEMPSRW